MSFPRITRKIIFITLLLIVGVVWYGVARSAESDMPYGMECPSGYYYPGGNNDATSYKWKFGPSRQETKVFAGANQYTTIHVSFKSCQKISEFKCVGIPPIEGESWLTHTSDFWTPFCSPNNDERDRKSTESVVCAPGSRIKSNPLLCEVEVGVCGDKKVDPGEQCDVGPGGEAKKAPEYCTNECRLQKTCGDWITDKAKELGSEECDEGKDKNGKIGGTCTAECKKTEVCKKILDNGGPENHINITFLVPSDLDEQNAVAEIRDWYINKTLNAIEPYQSNIKKFNAWYKVVEPVVKSSKEKYKKLSGDELEKINQIKSCADGITAYYAPYLTNRRPTATREYDLLFLPSIKNGRGDDIPTDTQTFAHEFGHLFTLEDEYIELEHGDRYGPNCAATITEAKNKWSVATPSSSNPTFGQSLYEHTAFYTGDPELCFDTEQRPISGCRFGVFIGSSAYSFTPSPNRSECVPADKDSLFAERCMVLEGGTALCQMLNPEGFEPCEETFSNEVQAVKKELVNTVIPDGFSLNTLTAGCAASRSTFIPTINSLMRFTAPAVRWTDDELKRAYGVVNEHFICEDIARRTGTKPEELKGVCAPPAKPRLTFAPFPSIPATSATGIAAYNIPSKEILHGKECGEESADNAECVRLLNLADKDKFDSDTEVPEQYHLRPFVIKKDGGKKEKIWMTLRNPYQPQRNEQVTYGLLGSITNNPDKPIITKTVTFESFLEPIRRLFDIEMGRLEQFKTNVVKLASLSSLPFISFSQEPTDPIVPALPSPRPTTNIKDITISSDGAGDQFALITANNASDIAPVLVYPHKEADGEFHITPRVVNASGTTQAYTVALYGLEEQGVAATILESSEVTLESQGGECRGVGGSSPPTKAQTIARVLIVESDVISADRATMVEKLSDQLLRFVPFSEFSKQIDVQYYTAIPSFPCLDSYDAAQGTDKIACAQEIQHTLASACSRPYDLIVVLNARLASSWRSGATPIVLIDKKITIREQAAIVANALGRVLGLGDEFEYKEGVAQFEQTTPNCLVGDEADVIDYWKGLVGGSSDAKNTISAHKGCGDFSQAGLRPSQQSLMSAPLTIADDPNAFGAVNQAYLRKALKERLELKIPL